MMIQPLYQRIDAPDGTNDRRGRGHYKDLPLDPSHIFLKFPECFTIDEWCLEKLFQTFSLRWSGFVIYSSCKSTFGVIHSVAIHNKSVQPR